MRFIARCPECGCRFTPKYPIDHLGLQGNTALPLDDPKECCLRGGVVMRPRYAPPFNARALPTPEVAP